MTTMLYINNLLDRVGFLPFLPLLDRTDTTTPIRRTCGVQMNNPDKDIRYMATNDLMAELKKEFFSPDEALERKIVQQMLKLLEDKNGEVQNLVVKCLAPLTSRLREQQQEEVLEGLMRALTSGKDEVREVSSIGPSPMKCQNAVLRALTRLAFKEVTVGSNRPQDVGVRAATHADFHEQRHPSPAAAPVDRSAWGTPQL